jgi:hypothetical protein
VQRFPSRPRCWPTTQPADPATAQQRREESQAWHHAQLAAHIELAAEVTHPIAGEVLSLHAPVRDNTYPWLICNGCDYGGMESEPPEWPCRTYTLVADRHNWQFEGSSSQPTLVRRTTEPGG